MKGLQVRSWHKTDLGRRPDDVHYRGRADVVVAGVEIIRQWIIAKVHEKIT
jgi:hypothetical protein